MNTVQTIEVFIDDWNACRLVRTMDKNTVAETSTTSEFTEQRLQSTKSPRGLFQLAQLSGTSVTLSSSCMAWIYDTDSHRHKEPPELRSLNQGMQPKGLVSMFTSMFTKSSPQPPPKVEPPQDPLKVHTDSIDLTIYESQLTARLPTSLRLDLERATKKPCPSSTRLSIIFSDRDTSCQKKSEKTFSKDLDIFSGIRPREGKVFIGQATGQTSGFGGHLAARFIPTVERESIDLNDRSVSVWNKELLYMAGLLSRAIYELRIADIRTQWSVIHSRPPQDGPDSKEDKIKSLLDQATYVMNYFTFYRSSPSSQVAKLVETAFFSCVGSSWFPIISTQGVLNARSVRLPQHLLEQFTQGIPVAILTTSPLFIERLKERGLLEDIGLDDVVGELKRAPLTEKQWSAFVEWWKILQRLPEGHSSTRANLLKVIKLQSTLEKDPQDIHLVNISSYLNPNTIPPTASLPCHCIPYLYTNQLQTCEVTSLFGWSELSIPEWLKYSINNRMFDSPSNAEDILGVVSRAWARISQAQRLQIEHLLRDVACVPTSLGMKRPGDSYHQNVRLFEDLPTVSFTRLQPKGTVLSMLDCLGVRSVIDLQLIFTRLVGKSIWSCYDLVTYLASIRHLLSAEEIERLRKTPAFSVWRESQGPDTSERGRDRTLASALCEPTTENRQLGIKTLDYGTHPWKTHSAEAKLMYDLGLRKIATLSVVLDAAVEAERNQAAINYLLRHIQSYPDLCAPEKLPNIAFVPAVDSHGMRLLGLPTQVYIDKRCAALGCLTIDSLTESSARMLGLYERPEPTFLIEYLRQTPPSTFVEAQRAFSYMATRIVDLRPHLDALSRIAFIPVSDGRSATPFQTLIRSDMGSTETYDLFKDVYHFVNFGEGNIFLEFCGVQTQPSHEQVARLLIKDPGSVLESLGSTQK